MPNSDGLLLNNKSRVDNEFQNRNVGEEEWIMHVKILSEKERGQIETLCKKNPGYNFFIITSLNYLSREQEMVKYWGQFDGSGNLEGVLMRYNQLWYICDTPKTDLALFGEVVIAQNQRTFIVNDNLLCDRSLIPYLKGYKTKMDLRGQLVQLDNNQFEHELNSNVRMADLNDVEKLIEFYQKSPQDVRRGADSIKRSITDGRRTFILEVENEIVACALTTAELHDKVMIGGIHALNQSKNKEYIQSVLTGIIHSVVRDDKIPYIVVRDRIIHTVCSELGFKEMGKWRMVHMETI